MRIGAFKRTFKWYVVKILVVCLLLAFFIAKSYFPTQNSNEQEKSININSKNRKLLEEGENSRICAKVNTYEGDKCMFVKKYCSANGLIDYLQLRYCGLRNAPWLFYILALLWMILLFYILGDSAEANFCPSLTEISRLLRLSPDVAGVTFLALGNGAPDIASTVVGVLNGSTEFGIGEPIGAGLFITTVVIAAVSLSAEATVDTIPFIRDVITYLIAVVFVLVVGITGKMYIWQAIICSAIYVAYVIVVVLSRSAHYVYHLIMKKRNAKKLQTEDIDEEVYAGWNISSIQEKLVVPRAETYQPKIGIIRSFDKPKKSTELNEVENQGNLQINEKSLLFENYFEKAKDDIDVIEPEETKTMGMKLREKWEKFLDDIEWHEKSWFAKFTYFFEAPTILLRNLTIPKADPDEWNRMFTVLTPIFIPPFVFLFLGYISACIPGSPIPWVVVVEPLGILAAVIIYFTTSNRKPPRYHFIIVIICFLMSIVWIYFAANELLNLLQTIGIIWNVSDAILGLTVLAMGNSLGDLVSDVVIAKQGYARMAISACYGGACLNLLLGLGIAVTAHCLTNPYLHVELTKTMMISFLVLIVVLVSSLIVVPLCKFKSTKSFGGLLLGTYLVTMTVEVLVELGIIWK